MSVDPRTAVAAVAPALQRASAAGLWTEHTRAAVFHDLDRLRGRIAELHAAFPEGSLHAVAVKANPLVELLKVVVAAGAGLEAASWEEVQLALAAGCAADRIVFDSPAKTDVELKASLDLRCWINADNEDELRRMVELGVPDGSRIGLRVNPQVGQGAIAFTSTVGKTSKFGVPLEQAADLVARYPFITGLHVHTGSQGCGLDLLSAAAAKTAAAVEELGLAWLDVGGGVPVRYTDADPAPPSFGDWGAALSSMPGWGSRTVVTEIGRALHAGTGWALSRIEAVKDVNGRPTIVVHLGADFLLRRVYRPDDWDNEMVVLDPEGRPRQGALEPTDIAGPLCFSGDLIARQRSLPAARRGDLLLIRDVGAYTLSMWSRHCSRGLPPSLGYDAAGVRVLHRGESPEDVVAFWSLDG